MTSHRLKYRTRPYISDFEQFIGDFVTAHPQVAPDQREAWYRWWDKRVTPADLAAPQDAVPVKGYQYE